MQAECFSELAACESNRQCALDPVHPLREKIMECETSHCLTSAPTAQPTAAPTAVPTRAQMLPLSQIPGLHIITDSTELENLTELVHGYFHPAFAMNSVPINPARILGNIVSVDVLCDVGDSASADLDGAVLMMHATAMDCPAVNEDDPLQTFVISTRLVAQNAHLRGAALLVVYGDEDVTFAAYERSRYLVKRNQIPMPVVLINEVDAEAIVAMLEITSVNVQAQLSSANYCDSVWAYGIPLPDHLSPACCTAADAVLSYKTDGVCILF